MAYWTIESDGRCQIIWVIPLLLPLVFAALPMSGVRDLLQVGGWVGGVGGIMVLLLRAGAQGGEKVGKGEKGWGPRGEEGV